jgi:hypothetical protein
MVVCPSCGAGPSGAQPGRIVCPSCGARFDARHGGQAATSPFREAQGLIAELSEPPTGAIVDVSTPEHPRDLLIRRASPYPDPSIFFTVPYAAVCIVLGGAILTRIGSGFGALETVVLAGLGFLVWLGLWPAAVQLWGRERIWVDRDSLYRRRAVGRVGWTRSVPVLSIETWDFGSNVPDWPGLDGDHLAGLRVGDRPAFRLALGMRLDRSHLAWLANHLDSGIRLVRE